MAVKREPCRRNRRAPSTIVIVVGLYEPLGKLRAEASVQVFV